MIPGLTPASKYPLDALPADVTFQDYTDEWLSFINNHQRERVYVVKLMPWDTTADAYIPIYISNIPVTLEVEGEEILSNQHFHDDITTWWTVVQNGTATAEWVDGQLHIKQGSLPSYYAGVAKTAILDAGFNYSVRCTINPESFSRGSNNLGDVYFLLGGSAPTVTARFKTVGKHHKIVEAGALLYLYCVNNMGAGSAYQEYFIEELSLRKHSETYIEPRLTRPINYVSKMFSGTSLSGSSSRKIGDIEIANSDGFLDDALNNYIWDNKDVEVYVGDKDWTFDQYRKIFATKMQGATWDNDKVNIKVNDQRIFADSVQTDKYLGTGGVEGTESLKGTYKPVCYGYAKNVSPVLIDDVNLKYQVHNGPIHGVEVFFAGAKAVNGEGYTVDTDTGIITMLTNPNGIVTCNVSGSTGSDGAQFVNKVPHVIRRIAEEHAGLVWPNDFNIYSFYSVEQQATETVGIYVKNGELSLNAIFDSLMNSINGYWFIDRVGKLTISIFGMVGTIKSFDENTISSIKREISEPPVWSVDIAYARNYTPMNDSDIAGEVVNVDRKSYLQLEYVTKNASDEDIKYQYTANEQKITTNLYITKEAEYQAARRLAVFGIERSRYTIEIPYIDYSMRIGNGVHVSYPRFGLDDGKVFVVTGIQENARKNTTTLEIWG